MNKLKATLISIISILMIISCLSIALYFYLQPIESIKTYSVGTDKSGNPYIYVEYWSNKENNGVELLDIKLSNYATVDDFSKNEPVMYSKGIQFVGNDFGSINFDYISNSSITNPFYITFIAFPFGATNNIVSYYVPNVNTYYYDSQNGVSFKSFEELDENYRFKISINDDGVDTLYWMKFFGDYETQPSDSAWNYVRKYYEHIDLMNFASKCLDACRSNSERADANGNLTVNVGSMFDFAKYSSISSEVAWESELSTEKIKNILDDYAYINMKIHADGAKKASDSMFGIIADTSDFEYHNPDIADNYLIGKQVIELTEKHFDIANSVFDFTTRTKTYLDRNSGLNISILIDLDYLELHDLQFESFSDNVKTYKNRITSILLKQTVGGTVTYSEVII